MWYLLCFVVGILFQRYLIPFLDLFITQWSLEVEVDEVEAKARITEIQNEEAIQTMEAKAKISEIENRICIDEEEAKGEITFLAYERQSVLDEESDGDKNPIGF